MPQVLPAWHSLMVARRPLALYVSNCQQVPAIVAAVRPRVRLAPPHPRPRSLCLPAVMLHTLLIVGRPAGTLVRERSHLIYGYATSACQPSFFMPC